MNKKRTILTILAALMITATLVTPMFIITPVQAATQHDPSWYMTVPGVLDSDTYELYPFKTDKSLKWGFSKFGEMIDSITNVGLEYRDRDAFAPAAGSSVPSQILKHKWMSGWLINITYNNPVLGMRNVWAVAQHADLQAHGYDWIRVSYTYTNVTGHPINNTYEDPRDPGLLISNPGAAVYRGGRKTNGTASTENIRVLYDGPRRFVARTVTHIYDWTPGGEAENEPLVDIVFTYIFNKDKKEVIVIKDIKEATTKFVFGLLPIPGDEGQREVNAAFIQFSNRGEWDIGPSPPTTPYFSSYAHFYTAGNGEPQYTDYDIDYHLNPTLPDNPYSSWGPEPKSTGTYDLAQIVSADFTYVGWAAFWPSLSNWHVDAGYQDEWWKSLDAGDDRADRTVGPEPWQSPYLIGEWDFMLTKERTPVDSDYTFDRQFRGVTVYGLTDLWNGSDANKVIDREVEYQLGEVFTPWDLNTAVEKDTRRWVDFHEVTTGEKTAAEAGTNLVFSLENTPVKFTSAWDNYSVFSERVEWLDALKHPARSVWVYPSISLSSSEPYELSVVSSTGVGTITIRAASVPAAGTAIKILYSTYTYLNSGYIGVPLYTYTSPNYNKTAGWGTDINDSTDRGDPWTDALGIYHNPYIEDFALSVKMLYTPTSGNWSYTNTWTRDWYDFDFKVWRDTTYTDRAEFEDMEHGKYNSTSGGTTANEFEITNFDTDMKYEITTGDDNVHIWHLHPDVDYTLTVSFTNYTNWQQTGKRRTWFNVTMAVEISPDSLGSPYYNSLYVEEIYGRYEWGIIGNHSRAGPDSGGLAAVSAAFKNKQVEYGNSGLDMTDLYAPNTPWMLRDFGHGTWRATAASWLTWYDSIGRLHLADDWCTRYPVSTSNIITEAGPLANLVSEYFNDLTDAIWIYSLPTMPIDGIFAPMCWNTTVASNYLGQSYFGPGHGVITTYKDINGTVGFMIYGWSADDTYYVSKWFHEFGIYYMQHENPGVTTWILKLDYTEHTGDGTRGVSRDEGTDNYDVNFGSHYPEVWRVERLGTISEKTPHDP